MKRISSHEEFWKEYYALAKDTPPAKILRVALEKYSIEKGEALDVGAGHLVESMFLLEQGFIVTALDNDPTFAELARKVVNSSFHFIQETIQNAEIPQNHFSLICALNILPHIQQSEFESVLFKIQSSLKSNGVFCGNFFGERDQWNNTKPTHTFVSIDKVREYFKDFEILFIGEREFEDMFGFAQIQGTEETKHWHIINLIARKK